MLIVCLGDSGLDVIVRLDQPIDTDQDTWAETTFVPGGQAANVAAWVATLGGRARLLSARSSGPAAAISAAEFERRGIEQVGPLLDGRDHVVVSVVGPDGVRSMLTDRGVSAMLGPEHVTSAHLDGADHLQISGYVLLEERGSEAAARAARLARLKGATVGIGLAASTRLRELGSTLRERIDEVSPDVILGNELEDDAMNGRFGAPLEVVTRGPLGATVRTEGRVRTFTAEALETVDATGAGDAFAAGFVLGGSIDERVARAMEAGRRAASTIGAMPSA